MSHAALKSRPPQAFTPVAANENNMRRPIVLLSFVVAMMVCIAGGIAHFHSHSKVVAPRQKCPAANPIVPSVAAMSVSTVLDDFVSSDDWLFRATNSTSLPDVALTMGRQFLADDPADENGRAARLLLALCNAGQFQTALAFAAEAPADFHADWTKLIYTHWAQSRPLEAIKSLDSITNLQQHSAAFHAVADGWNAGNPAGLAAYAISLPPGEDRDYALDAALDNWSLQDPAALGAWLNTLPRGAEFDYGAALMIARSDGVNRSPEVAMRWVESIGNAALKQDLLAGVLREWSQTDAAAAQDYVAAATWLDDAQRREILEKIFTAH